MLGGWGRGAAAFQARLFVSFASYFSTILFHTLFSDDLLSLAYRRKRKLLVLFHLVDIPRTLPSTKPSSEEQGYR